MAEASPPPANQITKITIDASAMAKWWLDDEEFVAQVRALKAEAVARRASLAAPTHLFYEVTNILRRAVRSNRISRSLADEAIEELLAFPVQFTDAPLLLRDALDLSLRLNLSFYDACYLLIAELSDGVLVSDDRNLRRALGGSHPRVTWLENYQP